MALTSGQKAARTRRLKEAGRKAAATRKRSAARRATSSAEPGGEAKGLTNWRWREGVVDVQGEHIELRYGDAGKSAYEQWLPIALIGKPTNHVFPVLWVMSSDNPSHERMIDAARKELDYYLVEPENRLVGRWEYAKYHCNTYSNMISRVHWSYFPNGNRGQRISSIVVTLVSRNKTE